ncbi:hypothetical protein GCM10023085_54060 [Actinomadura viridis]|uniref:Uncharacterized protein n=1 Tax=Actinomadura viridis TaxID=58110 RepID=A0A931DA25_9ACTN|nr:hypothetical protein [Actinomadura viridis]MBG6086365.1 hypothetical protein [Actinomadura viridis]
MDDGFLQRVNAMVRAATAEDQAFSDLMPQVMKESQGLPPVVLNLAMMKMGEGIAAAPPNLGCWLAIMAGAWVENGATTFGVEQPLLDRTIEVADSGVAFADAWRAATGNDPPSPSGGQPSQEIVDTLAPRLQDPVGAMMAWFSMERFALGANTMLSKSPELRAGVGDRERKVSVTRRMAEHCEQMGWVAKLLRVLDNERLLVLDRRTRQGWTVTIGGIGDNFQLHTLLAGALLGRPGGLPGTPPTPEIIACFLDADTPPGRPVISSPWNLVDAHGEWIYNEGVPADVPAVNGTRVIVLDPPSYERHFPAGRHHPMMAGSLTLDGLHLPEDLAGWWPHIAPARNPVGA